MVNKSIAWVLVLLVLVALPLLWRFLSPEARERRRRERSHRKVVSRKRGPWVKLAVSLKKPKPDQDA